MSVLQPAPSHQGQRTVKRLIKAFWIIWTVKILPVFVVSLMALSFLVYLPNANSLGRIVTSTVTTAQTKIITVPNQLINGKSLGGHTQVKYLFTPSGQVLYWNNKTNPGNATVAIPFFTWTGFAGTTSQAASQFFTNGTFWKFNYNVNLAGHTAIISIIYKQKFVTPGSPSTDLKIIINGTFSSTGTVQFQFTNNSVAPTVCTSASQPTQVQFGSTAFDWGDFPSATYNCSTNRLTFPITTLTFVIDPVLIGTTTNIRSLGYSDERKLIFDQGNWILFYRDGATGQYQYVQSLDGGNTWNFGGQIETNVGDWPLDIYYYASNHTVVYAGPDQRCGYGTIPANLVSFSITWTYQSHSCTITGGGSWGSDASNTLDNSTNWWVISQSSLLESTSKSSPSFATQCTTNQGVQRVLQDLDHDIEYYGGSGNLGTGSLKFYDETCTLKATTTGTNYIMSGSGGITYGKYIIVCSAQTTGGVDIIYYDTSTDTIASEALITGAGTTYKDCSLTTDGNSIFATYDTTTTIYQQSCIPINCLRQTFGGQTTFVSGRSNIVVSGDDASLNCVYALNAGTGCSWMEGTSSPFNIEFFVPLQPTLFQFGANPSPTPADGGAIFDCSIITCLSYQMPPITILTVSSTTVATISVGSTSTFFLTAQEFSGYIWNGWSGEATTLIQDTVNPTQTVVISSWNAIQVTHTLTANFVAPPLVSEPAPPSDLPYFIMALAASWIITLIIFRRRR